MKQPYKNKPRHDDNRKSGCWSFGSGIEGLEASPEAIALERKEFLRSLKDEATTTKWGFEWLTLENRNLKEVPTAEARASFEKLNGFLGRLTVAKDDDLNDISVPFQFHALPESTLQDIKLAWTPVRYKLLDEHEESYTCEVYPPVERVVGGWKFAAVTKRGNPVRGFVTDYGLIQMWSKWPDDAEWGFMPYEDPFAHETPEEKFRRTGVRQANMKGRNPAPKATIQHIAPRGSMKAAGSSAADGASVK